MTFETGGPLRKQVSPVFAEAAALRDGNPILAGNIRKR